MPDSKTLSEFATRYTAAWCSQHAASVASFFEEHGYLKIQHHIAARKNRSSKTSAALDDRIRQSARGITGAVRPF